MSRSLNALRQLGPRPLMRLALYRFGLKSGHYRRATPATPAPAPTAAASAPVAQAMVSPPPLTGSERSEAGEIKQGWVRLFGAQPVPLQLAPPGPLRHWTEYETGRAEYGVDDVKLLWEPARFGWAYSLGQAYRAAADESYAQAFWRYAETFLDANPPNLGPNWASAQEVALRLLALFYARAVFAGSAFTTPERRNRLDEALAAHAQRIPPTLVYAQAQQNNHLISEALGLYAAGLALPKHPRASYWKRTGWRWLNRALVEQIAPSGAYAQHSANYTRLVLQLALWAHALEDYPGGLRLPERTILRLRAATSWLLALVDPVSGCVPNLGANDGAYLIPGGPFDDYRPVLQAASLAFLGRPAFPPGPWDRLARALDPIAPFRAAPDRGMTAVQAVPPIVLRHPSLPSWAYLRAAHYRERPSHADQLHLDLWLRGANIALDPGTFQYNAPSPWDNALVGAAVHNTLTVEGQEQMAREGRFLWLNWAQAEVTTALDAEVAARHTGYRALGVVHERVVSAVEDGWRIEDRLLPLDERTLGAVRSARLHWLLPDVPWKLAGTELALETAAGKVTVSVQGGLSLSLARAGELLAYSGEGPPPQVEPIRGWRSPTYTERAPALSLAVEARAPLPLTLVTRWRVD